MAQAEAKKQEKILQIMADREKIAAVVGDGETAGDQPPHTL